MLFLNLIYPVVCFLKPLEENVGYLRIQTKLLGIIAQIEYPLDVLPLTFGGYTLHTNLKGQLIVQLVKAEGHYKGYHYKEDGNLILH